MTTTAAATVAVSGSPVLELLDRIDRRDELSVQDLENAMSLRTLSLVELHPRRLNNRLTAAGRDLLDRCTR